MRSGHGPLSHAFESTFLPAAARLASAVSTPAAPGKPAAAPPEWHHEWASVRMLEHLVDRNGLMDEFRARGLTRESLHFVQELILGDPEDAPPEFAWTGRPEKQFLYDIVANKANGIDTDKVRPRYACDRACRQPEPMKHVQAGTPSATRLSDLYHDALAGGLLHERCADAGHACRL